MKIYLTFDNTKLYKNSVRLHANKVLNYSYGLGYNEALGFIGYLGDYVCVSNCGRKLNVTRLNKLK